MDYQEIVTKYKGNGLATNNLRKRLDVAKPLAARPRYRVLEKAGRNWYYYSSTTDLITVKENPARLDLFEKNSRFLIDKYFGELIEGIKQCQAWDFMGIKARDFSKERFENAKLSEKFSIIYELNQKYRKFLEYQKLADLRGMFVDGKAELDDQTLRKMCFIRLMFGNLKSEDVKTEFFCFDESFLHALLRYKTSKDIRLEEHMKNQKKSIADDYKKFEHFFSTEDYRDIIENILLASKATKLSRTEIMRIYSQMSETEAEQEYLRSEMQAFQSLEEKCHKMNEVRLLHEKERIIQENKERDKRLAEEGRRKAEELKKRQEEAKLNVLKAKQKAEAERKIAHSEGYTEELDRRIAALQKTPTAKEAVIPVLFIWLDKENTTLTRKLGNQKLATFFSKLKSIENETGRRPSLFLITNADQETTKKRVEDLRKKAEDVGIPRLVEGALGGYSSFRVDESGAIKEVSKMSPENREKIKLLLESSVYTSLPRSMIDETEKNYIRYKFSDKPDKSITKTYLGMLVGRMLNDERVRRQPLKFMPFIEKNATGIDVVLESQVKGISKVHEYYECKYDISLGKSYKVNIETIDQFLEEKIDPTPDVR